MCYNILLINKKRIEKIIMKKDEFFNDITSNLEDLFGRLNPQENNILFNETGDNLHNLLTLGEIPKKMFKIGLVQEELKKIGFDYEVRSEKFNIINIDCLRRFFPLDHKYYSIDVRFTLNYAYLSPTNEYFYFDTKFWEQNLLNRVRLLIGDTNDIKSKQ